MDNKLIINFTPTGMIPTKEMTPHVPVSVSEIVEDVHRVCELGITKIHSPYHLCCYYRYLENRNINVKFSISNYFNKSVIRFKKKLNSRPLKLYLNIELL